MVAIIPARGGSKGLPGKNIKELNGKPLIFYTIKAALDAEGIDRVVVSTDSQEIARVAMEAGAEVPFLRPERLSTDTANAADVYLHAIDYISEEQGYIEEKFMVLLPTAPLRNSVHIEEAIELFSISHASTLISIKEAEVPVRWYLNKNEDGHIFNANFGSGRAEDNRQNNKIYYVPNGAIYILDYYLLKDKKTYYDECTIGYVMDNICSVDIDNLFDFQIAEFIMQRMMFDK